MTSNLIATDAALEASLIVRPERERAMLHIARSLQVERESPEGFAAVDHLREVVAAFDSLENHGCTMLSRADDIAKAIKEIEAHAATLRKVSFLIEAGAFDRAEGDSWDSHQRLCASEIVWGVVEDVTCCGELQDGRIKRVLDEFEQAFGR